MVKKRKEKKSDKSRPKETSPPKRKETMTLVGEREIALDFAMKVYQTFDQMIKSIVLFGSSAKKVSTPESDIDLIIILDDVSINWDDELIAWYREEMGRLIKTNPYRKSLHINSVKLSTWWDDLMRGDPVVINILRYGDALVDFGGFFNPLRILLKNGKIRSTPESIYTLLQRAPTHMIRANQSMLSVIDGLYWTMVDSAHAALISANVMPASPEEIPEVLDKFFVQTGRLNKRFVKNYEEVYSVAKDVSHGKISTIKGSALDEAFKKTDEFLNEMTKLVDELTEEKKG